MGGLRRTVSQLAPVRALWRVWNRPREATAAGTTPVGDAARRLLIGPANSAEQAYAWSRAAERVPGVAAAAFMHRRPDDVFDFRADHIVSTATYVTNTRWHADQRRAILDRFTHVVAESGRPLWGPTTPARQQLDEMTRAGIDVALVWHGSDIRVPSRHAETHDDSPFRGQRYAGTDRLEQIVSDNLALAAAIDAPMFVSTPDLLAYVPEATWLPVVIDLERWSSAAKRPALDHDALPVVAHAPSNAGLKGSELIEETMRRLHAEGLVDYREVRAVPAARMPQVYGEADIVLDQFALGTYGVAAGEAMACGRLVISYVGDHVRGVVAERTGRSIPIIESAAADVEEAIRAVIADRRRYAAVAAEGPAFVAAVHDGTVSASVLGGFLSPTDCTTAGVGESTDG